MTPRVAILDYGCGNLRSVVNAVREVGGEPFITQSPLVAATHLILPGQGAFCALPFSVSDGLNSWRHLGKPILGICLGMQLMCEGSEEAPGVKGLGWIPAPCTRLHSPRLPNIGWLAVPGLGDFYFCHSYGVWWSGPGDIAMGDRVWPTMYDGQQIIGALVHANLWAVQFHPEKSGKAGLAFLREFLAL